MLSETQLQAKHYVLLKLLGLLDSFDYKEEVQGYKRQLLEELPTPFNMEDVIETHYRLQKEIVLKVRKEPEIRVKKVGYHARAQHLRLPTNRSSGTGDPSVP